MIIALAMFQGGLGALGGLLPMLLIIGVFYVLLIRPQQKRQKELQQTISQLKTGDRVVTTGGIIGTITTVRDTSFLIRSGEKTILEIARSAVAGIEKEESASAHDHNCYRYSPRFVCCDRPAPPARASRFLLVGNKGHTRSKHSPGTGSKRRHAFGDAGEE